MPQASKTRAGRNSGTAQLHPEPVARPESVEDSGFRWSRRSERNLLECDPRIQLVMDEALRTSPRDMMIICGHRSREAQEAAHREGRSKLRYPQSKHNAFPSRAVDVVPYPLDWYDLESFAAQARHILATAERLGVKMRWGGDWDQDGDWKDESFFDGPHFELI